MTDEMIEAEWRLGRREPRANPLLTRAGFIRSELQELYEESGRAHNGFDVIQDDARPEGYVRMAHTDAGEDHRREFGGF